ncbi:hypothetical protein [Acidovorax sp. Root219]|uniref:hypothetical protein n=1 Tax=Acidovorax sp. Root219 TaxID=1736493 RepID=UPI00070FADDD|nr:hypothetical protein [Acidovorax sp. Root219]KRC36251.1 hypothetical protein ASE28_01580 [Acidovorax sp. Root219]
MSDIQPTFAGEVQLRRWSESSTQGVQVTFALADSADLDRFKGMDGKRFMAVLVQVGDDEEPVPPGESKAPREKLGDLCFRAVHWCRDAGFQAWLAMRSGCAPEQMTEDRARQFILTTCRVGSRKDLDTDPLARQLFNDRIRAPYHRHVLARGGY